MKKIITLTLGLMFLITLSYAEKNDQEINLFLGFGSAITDIESSTLANSWESGGTGIALAGNFLHSISDNFLAGGELFYSNPGKGAEQLGIRVSSRYTNFYVAGKYLFNPMNEKNRLYIPFGLGFGETKMGLDATNFGHDSATSSGFAWYLGIGWQHIIDPKHNIGLELRIAENYFDKNDFGLSDNSLVHSSFMFKVGFDI